MSTLPSLQHLRRLTDDVGLVQHARYDEPYYPEGYSIDDNARALILMVECQQHEPSDELEAFASRYLAYIRNAFNARSGRFRNFADRHGRWIEESGSEDSHGRSLHALGHTAMGAPDLCTRAQAARLFELAVPAVEHFTSPRAWAFALLGLDRYARSCDDRCDAARLQETLAQRLLDLFERTAADDWPWFEDILSYCNAKIPHALLVAGSALDRTDMIDTALDAMAWLAIVHSADDGHFTPVGSDGFFKRGGERALFDQQPIEAHAVVAAGLEAHRTTRDEFWLDEARRAHEWFLGANHLGAPVGDADTGACYDGLHEDRVNLNRGAESTLAFLLSTLAMDGGQRSA